MNEMTRWIGATWFRYNEPFDTFIVLAPSLREACEKAERHVMELARELYDGGDWGLQWDEFLADLCWDVWPSTDEDDVDDDIYVVE